MQTDQYEDAIVRLMSESRRDSLTDLGNYKAFREYTGNLHSLGVDFAVILFDMTNLKQANTALGHFGADQLLANVGASIRESVGDRVFRHGGDEFAVVLPRASDAGAVRVRDRIEKAVGVSRLPRCSALVAAIGAVCTIEPSMDVDVVLNRGDKQLEQRKAAWKANNVR